MSRPSRSQKVSVPLSSRLHPGFLATFSLVGLLALVGLALVLSKTIGAQVRDDQLENARDTAQILAASVIAPALLDDAKPGPVRFRRLDEALGAASANVGFETIVALDPDGRVLYANDHRLIGRKSKLSPLSAEALHGAVALRVQDRPAGRSDLSHGKQIAVAVPIVRRGEKRVSATVEVRRPYGPVQSVVSSRTRELRLVLFGAGLLLYAALWPRLLAASRALKRNADPGAKKLVRELRDGLDRNELVVHFQPKVCLREGRVTGMEALVRWNHPKRGLLAPDQFVPAAMAGGLTGPLTIHVANLSLSACRAWHARGIDAGVNINLGAANVLDERLPAELGLLLDHWNLPPTALGVEITESAIASDPDRAGAVLAKLDAMGLRIAIDDFGTGYSSLAGLRTLPVHELKVDRSFVSGLTTEPGDAAIVRSVIGLAHELGIEVIAEGVEDEATMNALAALGCDQVQGYFIGRPMDLAKLLDWLAAPGLAAPAVPAAA
jgi:EAL domain-containing protein (putative c-di-GMP-specific phosphodiesterase class I)